MAKTWDCDSVQRILRQLYSEWPDVAIAMGELARTFMERTGGVGWQVFLETSHSSGLTVTEICEVLCALKLARIRNGLAVADSRRDLAGYALIGFAHWLALQRAQGEEGDEND